MLTPQVCVAWLVLMASVFFGLSFVSQDQEAESEKTDSNYAGGDVLNASLTGPADDETMDEDLIFRPLKGVEIRKAQNMLYDIYVEEMGWDLEKQTPNYSKLTAHHDTRRLTSRFDDVAVWFGCFDDEGELVMCMRALPEDPLGFEISQFIAPVLLDNNVPAAQRKTTWEVARIAKAKHVRGKRPLLKTFHAQLAKYLAEEHGATYLMVSPPVETMRLHTRAGFEIQPDSEFKYSPNDPSPCMILTGTTTAVITAGLGAEAVPVPKPVAKPVVKKVQAPIYRISEAMISASEIPSARPTETPTVTPHGSFQWGPTDLQQLTSEIERSYRQLMQGQAGKTPRAFNGRVPLHRTGSHPFTPSAYNMAPGSQANVLVC